MATFNENIATIAAKLTSIDNALTTISVSMQNGAAIDLTELIRAVKDLQFNGSVFDFGEFLYEKHLNTETIEDW